MNPAASRIISIMAFSMCFVPVNQTLNENRSRIKAWLPWVDWYPSLAAVGASVIILPRHIRPTPRRRCGHSMTVIMDDSVIILLMVSVLILPVTMSFTL